MDKLNEKNQQTASNLNRQAVSIATMSAAATGAGVAVAIQETEGEELAPDTASHTQDALAEVVTSEAVAIPLYSLEQADDQATNLIESESITIVDIEDTSAFSMEIDDVFIINVDPLNPLEAENPILPVEDYELTSDLQLFQDNSEESQLTDNGPLFDDSHFLLV